MALETSAADDGWITHRGFNQQVVDLYADSVFCLTVTADNQVLPMVVNDVVVTRRWWSRGVVGAIIDSVIDLTSEGGFLPRAQFCDAECIGTIQYLRHLAHSVMAGSQLRDELRDSLNVGEDLSRDSGDEGNSQGEGDDACKAHGFSKQTCNRRI